MQRFFETGETRRLSVQNSDRIGQILRALNVAEAPEDLNVPGLHFHRLRGEKRYSVRVTGNWRITFAFEGVDAVDVDLEDYH